MARSVDVGKLAEWRTRLERFRRAGISVTRFCRSESVSVASFYQWRKKVATGSARQNDWPRAVEAFAPVRLVGTASVAAWLPGGTRIEIRAGYDFVGTVLFLLLNFTGDMPARERAEAARELCNEASDLIERFTGKSWESPQATAIGGTAESDVLPGGHNNWLHDAGLEPPEHFYRDKWLTGTLTEIGFAIRHAKLKSVKSERALRDYLKNAASSKSPRVWCRATLTTDIDAFFRNPKSFHDAEARLSEYGQRKPKEVGGSPRKPLRRKSH